MTATPGADGRYPVEAFYLMGDVVSAENDGFVISSAVPAADGRVFVAAHDRAHKAVSWEACRNTETGHPYFRHGHYFDNPAASLFTNYACAVDDMAKRAGRGK